MAWYVEWTSVPQDRAGRMIPVEQAMKLAKLKVSGYTSVYQFSEEAASVIRASGRSKGFKNFKCSSPYLIIDCDLGVEGAKPLEAILESLGVGYVKWFSGSKGFHYYIKMEDRVQGIHLPYSHKRWVIENGLSTYADVSLYRANSLIAAPNRVHPKTGKRKTFVKNHPGKKIYVPYVEPPNSGLQFDFSGEQNVYDNAMMAIWGLAACPETGLRHTRLWGASRDLALAGLPYETCRELLLFINSNWSNPKEEEEVLRAVDQGYLK